MDYAARMQRINDAIQLKTPDRVPLLLATHLFPARYAGLTHEQAFYDLDKWLAASEKTILDYQPDLYFPPLTAVSTSGAVHEALGSTQIKWPGHGMRPGLPFQFVEGEYMRADEYDALLDDPSDFSIRTYMPRIFSALTGFSMLPPLMAPLLGYPAAGVVGMLTIPPVAAALQALNTAAQEAARWTLAYSEFEARMNGLGFPSYAMTVALAPFDVISDMLRGMRGAIMDMYRQPDKLIAAQDKLLPFLIKAAIFNAQMSGNPRVFIPLHRGADGFMSLPQFETFYWPGLKGLLLALVEAGLTPCPFFEGSYTQRLGYLRELPPGKILGLFDRTDLFKAKRIIGDVMCIAGDVPLSLLQTGTPDQIKSYSKNLIDVVGKGGGFIMSSNTVLDEADPELLKVWCDFSREYGAY
jgi:hypothetical protein